MLSPRGWLSPITPCLRFPATPPTTLLLTSPGGWGGAGVYMFFVISGFIMVHISWENFGKRGASADFLGRRIIRIVPLYWLATLAALASHKVWATHGTHAGWMDLAYSLAFIPYFSGEDGWYPILPGGWTLNYEMMFYAVFALGLTLPRKLALPTVGTALVALIFVGPYFGNGGCRVPCLSDRALVFCSAWV